MVYQSQEQISRTRWASFAAAAWCVVFGVVHLYWALGGSAGFLEFSLPTTKQFVVTRDPGYIRMTWAVAILCALAAIAALAPMQRWTRRIPRWLVLTPLWIVCGLFLVRGIGNPIQTALISAGIVDFSPLTGPDAQAWSEWLRLDLLFFSPWFVLGGLAFGAAAWFAGRHGDQPEEHSKIGKAQRYRLS
jgi:hypothetical protein